MARSNRKSRQRIAEQARKLDRKRDFDRQMRKRARFALSYGGTIMAVFAREGDLVDFARAIREAGIDGISVCRLDAPSRTALRLSTSYVVVRSDVAVASIVLEEDALLFEGVLAETDERGACRSVHVEVLDSLGGLAASYCVGPNMQGSHARLN